MRHTLLYRCTRKRRNFSSIITKSINTVFIKYSAKIHVACFTWLWKCMPLIVKIKLTWAQTLTIYSINPTCTEEKIVSNSDKIALNIVFQFCDKLAKRLHKPLNWWSKHPRKCRLAVHLSTACIKCSILARMLCTW